MAKRKPDEPKKGAPEWQCTFSDLMNLLLCFFVLLFSMSSVDNDKWEQVVASMSSAFSIFTEGSTSIGSGSLVGIGTSQLSNLDEYYTSQGQTSKDDGEDLKSTTEEENPTDGKTDSSAMGGKTAESGENDKTATGLPAEDDKTATGQPADEGEDTKKAAQLLEEAGISEAQEMLDAIAEMTERYDIYGQIELSMDEGGKFVEMTISGSLLFDSGSAELKKDCLPLLSKVGDILKVYSDHDIDVIGHTDNVPMKSAKYESNDILSSARAISAAQYLVQEKKIPVERMSWTGRGEYEPVASNATAEGRALNRRVEIRIYNSYNSN